MNTGKTLFAQLMDFVPWSTFSRLVRRYGGDQRVRTLACAEQYRAMAFAQLTYRESLRDIETCLTAQSAKLYAMGFRECIHRSTLADANETRDWRIYAELAQRLIAQARKLYADEDLGLDLNNTAYALDSTTIDLCLSVFPWAHFRTTKAAVKMHTLLDLKGSIPTFIHISDGKLHDVNVLDLLLPEPGAIYVMDRGYVDFARLFTLHQAGAFFVTRAKSNMDVRRIGTDTAQRQPARRSDVGAALPRALEADRATVSAAGGARLVGLPHARRPRRCAQGRSQRHVAARQVQQRELGSVSVRDRQGAAARVDESADRCLASGSYRTGGSAAVPQVSARPWHDRRGSGRCRCARLCPASARRSPCTIGHAGATAAGHATGDRATNS
jgi:hypothetical protein